MPVSYHHATTRAPSRTPATPGWPCCLLLLALPACSGDPVAPGRDMVCLPLASGFTGNVSVDFQPGYEAKGGVTYEIVRGGINNLSVNATAPGGSRAEIRLTVTGHDSIRIIPVDPAMMGQIAVPLLEIDEERHFDPGVRIGEWLSFFTLATHRAASGSSDVTVTNSSALRIEILDATTWDPVNFVPLETIAIRQVCSAAGVHYLGV